MTLLPSPASASIPVLRRALALVRETRVALADPKHWCQGYAWACDKAGESVSSNLRDAALSPRAYARELLAAFFHEAWRHGYVVQLDMCGGVLQGFGRAPATVWVASQALADACLAALPSHDRHGQPLIGLHRRISSKSLDERAVLALSEFNEHATHPELLTTLDHAERTLQTELDQRKQRHAQTAGEE